MTAAVSLDLSASAAQLTAQLVDTESVSGNEAALADAVEAALRGYERLSVQRDGNVVIARTELGRPMRVVLAGHLDTVPIAGNLPSRVAGDRLYGCGTSDMKAGLALQLRAAALVGEGRVDPAADLTWFFYDCEEVEASRNGLNRVAASSPELLSADLAILLEPTNGRVEGGCQGTIRAVITVTGRRAHSARSWLGDNAIHGAAPVLELLAGYSAAEVEVEGLTYREGLNAVYIGGGVAGNVIPDSCTITVNYRFAPDKSEADAEAHLRAVFAGFVLEVVDSAPAARPGLDQPLAQSFVAALGQPAEAKLGWTDVARFSALGIPALNFGPGDPNLAHTVDEWVSLRAIESAEVALLAFLSSGA
ncbi:succinyl-diaminopimelate desuccinylase [Jatrophihabitans telluris]|uniref:Succinyl-diaminopimelate desuccinylase n=1 Tax=Jatrophihabitans telluris TaxID=2038343 RepID=A0ABY4QVL3_9ACTN|nr:succinyl-diaminopimelate desuccinylase [Jatrophihabitans telluris]UQX87708.1 succinyl-diaminopimelate desuccinylase [Jatrophihabitans telluris]